MAEPVKTHNAKFAALWNAAGRENERISESIADSIDHCIACLQPKSVERVLDVATGAGWTAAELCYLSFIRRQRESQQRAHIRFCCR